MCRSCATATSWWCPARSSARPRAGRCVHLIGRRRSTPRRCAWWLVATPPGSSRPGSAWCLPPPGWTPATSPPGRFCCFRRIPTPRPAGCGPASGPEPVATSPWSSPIRWAGRGATGSSTSPSGWPGSSPSRTCVAGRIRTEIRSGGHRRGGGRRDRGCGRAGQDQAGPACRWRWCGGSPSCSVRTDRVRVPWSDRPGRTCSPSAPGRPVVRRSPPGGRSAASAPTRWTAVRSREPSPQR